MNKEILEVVASVSMEKGVDKEIIFEALEEAIASASKKLLDDEALVNVVIDRKTGDYNTFRAWEIVDEVMNEVNEITEADVDKQEIVDGFAKVEIENIKLKFNRIPGLAVIQVGNVAASSVYVKAKTKAAKEVGINVIDHHLEESTNQNDLINLINQLNNNDDVNGILVQLPLPKTINEEVVLNSIAPEKDADGFHPLNVGKLSISQKNDESLMIPCTPYGCLLLLRELNINLAGKNAVVIGRSNIVGKPMAQLLLKESCTVTTVHSKTINIESICKKADILIAAIGKPEFVNKDWVKEGAIIIDVGINRIKINEEKSKLVGDVLFSEVENKVSAISPVPGGVGPMTIACLLRNTTIAFKNLNKIIDLFKDPETLKELLAEIRNKKQKL